MSQISFPADLPVSQVRHEIAAAIRDNQVVIVAGETGSGKTTQLPKIALSLGRKAIAHTQPRRIAARAVAERIAEELGCELGETVGYQVRFTDKSSRDTQIKLMTDGILLNAIHHDRLLQNYDTIIIDEAHERSLNIDFLMGYLRTLLPKRPDLKVIITSATIDPASFAKHFGGAPVVEVSGRSFPVEVRYRPLIIEEELDQATSQAAPAAKPRRVERDMYEAICEAARELLRDSSGDLLVFLSGEGEIKEAAEALRGTFGSGKNMPGKQKVEILPLYGRLSASEQHRVFSVTPSGTRRIVLATNVAETSLTVPGITAVIDTGTARISRYSSRSKVQRLPIEPIAQANAVQRAGRAGRTSPGIAIRLYSEEDFNARPLFGDPEILRTGLAAVLLQMFSLKLGEIAKFPFLTPPDARGVRDGISLLEELGAIRKNRITALGRALAKLPLEPRFGRMLLEAVRHDVTAQLVPLAAGLTIPDVRERPEDAREKADGFHARFNDPSGDLHTLLNLWQYLSEKRKELGSSAFRRLLQAEFLNVMRVREWFDLVAQLKRAVADLRLPENLRQPRPEAPKDPADLVHFCVLSGVLSHLGVRDDKTAAKPLSGRAASENRQFRRQRVEFLGARGTKFVLHPGSVLAKKPPETVMCIELVETSSLFGRMAAQITPEWAECLAGAQAKSTYSSPAWSVNRGCAVIRERVLLYGVPIVAGRTVPLQKIDAPLARQLFIREALVQGNWREQHAFERHNRQLRNELARLEEQTRQRGLVGDDDAVFEFFDRKLPETVCTATDFNAWWGKKSRQEPKFLHLQRADLLDETAAQAPDSSDFPRVWSFGDQRLDVKYRFEPGAADDGVTVVVPLPLLPRLRESEFAQLVPGLRLELVAALIKALPKPIRKHVIPANDWARTLLPGIEAKLGGAEATENSGGEADAQAGLPELLAQEIRRRAGVPVTAADFELERLPAHLRPTYRVVNAQGRTLGSGKELEALQKQYASSAHSQVAKVAQKSVPQQRVQQKELTSWPQMPGQNGDIPRFLDSSFSQSRGKSEGLVRAYPCLVDRRKHVDFELATSEQAAQAAHRLGVRRLVAMSTPSITSYVRDNLTAQEKLLLTHSPYRTVDDLLRDVELALAEAAILRHEPSGLVYSQDIFARVCRDFESTLLEESYRTVSLLVQICELVRAAHKAIDAAKSLHTLSSCADAAAQLQQLIFANGTGGGFVSTTGVARLPRLVVYLRAIAHRMQQLPANPGRDAAAMHEFSGVEADFMQAGGALPLPANASPALTQVRWALEELRVSLFAQQLGTAGKVSAQRIRKMLAEL
ncbi:MAG: ATP-dependent RNA helicase HrpA [Microbacteriaceae bacterium]|nr:ATP-dependent RNA helicase HrpA [Microbacteriaceae bacterium]